MKKLAARQIHLDFHTSPFIDGIGTEFDPDEFADTLVKANVNSINIFAKCHHGMYYYPTEIGTVHPHLECDDLFGKQLRACRERNIRALAYTCVVWNEDWADRHPEWLQVKHNGLLGGQKPFEAGFTNWRNLCCNHPDNVQYIKDEMEEIYNKYKPDGFWIDIVFSINCVCPTCKAEMLKMELDPENIEDVNRHDRYVEIDFMKKMFQFAKELDPELEIFFNGHAAEGDLGNDLEYSNNNKRDNMSFLDLESIPSDVWGYNHFPINVNLVNHKDYDLTMMNGKFQFAWGDFGSLRNLAALQYECFRGLALGAGCCIGDQMHPVGKLDKAVYERIGEVFGSIKEKEPWCLDTKKVANVAAFHSLEVLEKEEVQMGNYLPNPTNEGIYRMLTELNIPFDFIDFHKPLDGYDLVIIGDNVRLPVDVAKRVDDFVKAGGKLIVTGKAGLNLNRTDFAIDLGIKYLWSCDFTPCYIRPNKNFPSLPQMDTVLYETGTEIEIVDDDVKVIARRVEPYFNRTWDHFCSHRHSPARPEESFPLITQKGNVIYIAHPIFKDYANNAMLSYKLMVKEIIDRVGYNYLVKAELPSSAEVTIREKDNSYILHFLSYIPQRRCDKLDIIEDVIPLYNRNVKFFTDKDVSTVKLVPEGEMLVHIHTAAGIEFEIPEIIGHQMVEIEYNE